MYDLKYLINLQVQNPKIDIFKNIEKYNCRTRTDWTTPIEKFQSRSAEKFIELRNSHQSDYQKCIQDRIQSEGGLAVTIDIFKHIKALTNPNK